jgi:hypothetical protein
MDVRTSYPTKDLICTDKKEEQKIIKGGRE